MFELEEHDLGEEGTVEQALGLVLRRVFDETSLPRRGPWEMRCEVDADLVEQRVSMSIELVLVRGGAVPSTAIAGGVN